MNSRWPGLGQLLNKNDMAICVISYTSAVPRSQHAVWPRIIGNVRRL